MKSKAEITDYNDTFNECYNDGITEDALYEILIAHKSKSEQVYNLKQLLKQAYTLGLNTAAQDSLDTLRQYATACAGLPPKNITPDELYDQAAWGLMVYFTKTLDNFENKE